MREDLAVVFYAINIMCSYLGWPRGGPAALESPVRSSWPAALGPGACEGTGAVHQRPACIPHKPGTTDAADNRSPCNSLILDTMVSVPAQESRLLAVKPFFFLQRTAYPERDCSIDWPGTRTVAPHERERRDGPKTAADSVKPAPLLHPTPHSRVGRSRVRS